jgi:uncharacterized membrane protein
LRLQVLALVAGLAGLGVSVYLTVVHYSTIALACPANAVVNCEQVLASSFAVIGGSGMPTSTWRARGPRLARVQLAWSAIGLVTVVYLVYVEIVLLGAVCIWCSAAHLMVLVIFLVALTRLQRDRVAS